MPDFFKYYHQDLKNKQFYPTNVITTEFTEIKITSIVKKNVIQQQADDFMNHVVKSCDEYKEFIALCNKAMLNYKKNIHCIVFWKE